MIFALRSLPLSSWGATLRGALQHSGSLTSHLFLEDGLEGERNVEVTRALEELVLELDPVQT